MKFRSYKKLLSFLYTQLPMYQRVGTQAFKKDLGNIKRLATHLNNPQDKFPSVHIAGTNGKGSVTHLMASVLVSQGFKVGIYTSPHYFDFRERIKIGSDFISEKEVLNFVNKNYQAIAEIAPSFFEITVAMAFDHFARHQVDLAIIETGLGGRLDSTNIITPILSVITNISFDHQAMLGNTLSQIAKEKAGIIKKEVPIIVGEYQRTVAAVFKERAKGANARLSFASRARSKAFLEANALDEPLYMTKNKVTAYVALKELRSLLQDLDTSPNKITKGFDQVHKNVFYVGRWQKISERPQIYLDSAHNIAGLNILLDHLRSVTYSNLHLIIGFVNDKDHSSVLRLLPQKANYYFAKANIPRGLDARVLQAKAKEFNLSGAAYDSVAAAYNDAKSFADDSDLIVVLGSIFLIAEIEEANLI